MFSAFRSPDLDRLNEPRKTVSSATVTLACMKSWTSPAPYGVDAFAENRPAISSSSGTFQCPLPRRHCLAASLICGASMHPATSTRPAAIRLESAPRTGGVVSTGEQILTRRCARPIACATRCERSSPWPGVNHARMPSCHSGGMRPVSATVPAPRSCSNSRWKVAARSGESTTTITFSWRSQASSVQFVEPVQTERESRTMYLWCIRSGTPAIGNASTGRDSISSSSGAEGGGTGTGRACSTL